MPFFEKRKLLCIPSCHKSDHKKLQFFVRKITNRNILMFFYEDSPKERFFTDKADNKNIV